MAKPLARHYSTIYKNMKNTHTLVILILALTAQLIGAQTIELKSVEARIPEAFPLPSSQSGLDPSAIILNEGNKKFVFVDLELSVDFADETRHKLMINEFSAKVGDQIYDPIADSERDGRHLDIYRDVSRESETLRKHGEDESNIRTASLTLLFYFEPTEKFSIQKGDQSLEVSPKKVTRLEDAFVPKVTINEASLRDQFRITASRAIPQKADLEQVAAPLAGKVLNLKLQVAPETPNKIGTDSKFVLTPSDFRLVDKQQVIPMFQLVGRSSLMDNSIFTLQTSVDEAEARQRAALEGVPFKQGTEIELLFLVDPSASKWDLYLGSNKVGEILNEGISE